MNDKPNNGFQQHQGTSQTSKTPSPVLPKKEEATQADGNPNQGHAEPKNQELPKTRFERFKRWVWPMEFSNAVMILLTAFIALGTIVSAVAIGFQWHEMHEGGKDTTAIAEAAKKQAGAANSFATSAEGINTEIGTAEGDFAKMAKSSEDAINATRDTMRRDQRAWVGLLQMSGIPEKDKPYDVESILTNTGKTPAKKLVRLQRAIITVRGTKFAPDYKAAMVDSPNPSVSILLPNQFFRGTTRISEGKILLPTDIDSIEQGDKTIYVFGKVCYEDVFGKKHWERFCDFYDPRAKAYPACSEYNEIDTDKNGAEESCEVPSPTAH